MSTLVRLIRDYQQLRLADGSPAAELFERALHALLDAEGPPPEPIEGISSEARSAIARSPKGRPLLLCHTWQTDQWTCLLIDLAPVAMGRPVFVPNPAGKGLPRVVTDYRSQKFQRRIGAAYHALNLPPPAEPCRICCHLNQSRFFLAWAPFTGNAPLLLGDLDNYAKNVMDALQRARIVKNDRTIGSIAFTRTHLPSPAQSLSDHLLSELLRVKAEHPKLNQRALAKKAGLSQRTTRNLLAWHATKLAGNKVTEPKTSATAPGNPPITQDLPPAGAMTPPSVQDGADSAAATPVGDLETVLPSGTHIEPTPVLIAVSDRNRQRDYHRRQRDRDRRRRALKASRGAAYVEILTPTPIAPAPSSDAPEALDAGELAATHEPAP